MSDENKKLSVIVRNKAIIKNPVLFEAIGIAPVVAMSVSLKSAIMLSVVASVELILIELIACLLLKKLKSSLRVVLYAVLGVLINIPMFMMFIHFAPNETASVGIFLPLIAVNSLVALHCERVAVKSKIKATFIDAISSVTGYVLIIFIVGIVREILGSGSIYSYNLNLPIKLSGMLMPFGGFLMLGFIAAIFKLIIAKRYPDEKPEAAFNLSEISDSHVDNIRNLMAEDFNPYDEVWSKESEYDIKLKAYKPKFDDLENILKVEKISKPDKIKEEKPKKVKDKKPKKIKEDKQKKTKEKKIKENKLNKNKKDKSLHENDKVIDRNNYNEVDKQSSQNNTRHAREYKSEFDDLLSLLDNKENSNDNEGGDDK